jgi:TRAP-type C4-dicarboxylate transport system permease small subunit
MARFERFIIGTCSVFYWIARFALFAVMMLTCADVFFRYVFNHPLRGGYDLVALLGSIVISFSLPATTLKKSHVIMEALTGRLPEKGKRILSLVTGLLGVILFIIIGWNLLIYGTILLRSGEVFPTLRLPIFYPAYAIGLCCVVEILVLSYRTLVSVKGDSTV